MSQSHTQPCPCGSGLEYRICCGKILDSSATSLLTDSTSNNITLENRNQEKGKSPFEINIIELLDRGNLPQAETLLRMSLEAYPDNPKIYNLLGRIAVTLNLPQFAITYFGEAARLAPDWELPRINLARASRYIIENQAISNNAGAESSHTEKTEQFLLIKAWGYGFWADVSHVLGQLLLAEITGRIPIVHWGSNSLFGDGSDKNAFEFYFDKVSSVDINDIQKESYNFWPPKWNHQNLTQGEVNKWKGPFSRVAGLYLLNRPEKVIVSDFHTSIVDLRPWIPNNHDLYGKSVDELYRHLVRRYLKPRKEIVDEVNNFYTKYLASTDYVAMHVRGSDKVVEINKLNEMNKQYTVILDRYLAAHDHHRIFLMTDDSRILAYFVNLYGDRIITTNCRRSGNERGVHYQASQSGRQLGTEVMVDTYVAAKARAFIGNGGSNPSVIVQYLNDWSDGDIYIIGQSIYHMHNPLIHDW